MPRGVLLGKARPATAVNLVLRDRQPPPIQNAIPGVFSHCEGSSEWGLNVIRTIWLGFIFLIVLAAAGSFRFAFGHFDAANASGVVHPKVDRTVGTKAYQETSMKADRLRVASASPAPDDSEAAKSSVISAALLSRISPAIVAPDMAGRRWHEASAYLLRPTRILKARRKQAKPEVIASKPQPAAEPKACQLEEFDAFRWAFALPTGCYT